VDLRLTTVPEPLYYHTVDEEGLTKVFKESCCFKVAFLKHIYPYFFNVPSINFHVNCGL
jgi:hypothetical protein